MNESIYVVMKGWYVLDNEPIKKKADYVVNFSDKHIMDVKIENGEPVVKMITLPDLPSMWIMWSINN